MSFPMKQHVATKAATVRLPAGLSIGYGSVLATVGDEIELGEGTHYLLARNGRGKTTLLRTLAGLIRPLHGKTTVNGHCQFISDELSFDRELSAKLLLSSLLPRDRRQEAYALADELELDLKKAFGKLSTGNRKKVGLLLAEFSIFPDSANVVLFDEPFTGLDAPAREAFQRRWRDQQDGIVRMVSCHPDFDGMEMESALLISHEKISYGGAGVKSWADFKTQLT